MSEYVWYAPNLDRLVTYFSSHPDKHTEGQAWVYLGTLDGPPAFELVRHVWYSRSLDALDITLVSSQAQLVQFEYDYIYIGVL